MRRIISGESLHPSVVALAGKFASKKIPRQSCIDFIAACFDTADQDRYTDERWEECVAAVTWVYEQEEAKQTPPSPDEEIDWRARALRTARGELLSVVQNAVLALRHDPEVQSRLCYNEMLCQPMVRRNGSPPEPLSDNDITKINAWLQRAGLTRIGREAAKNAAFLVASETRYHPIREYLDGLKWDGHPRLHDWASVYLGAERSPYHDAVGAMFLRQMVARIYKPGCKADYMLVLEGVQGTIKSTVCSVLSGDEYFSDALRDVESKDASVHMRGKWVIEIAELHAMKRAETTVLKSFVTRRYEKYRPPYGSMEVNEPRQCVLIGTTNNDQYLRDDTGNRRFWGIKCGAIDLDRLRADRDQLFAEAVTEFRNEVPWWPDADFERELIEPEQDARYEEDPWHSVIRIYVAGLERVTTPGVATGALSIEIGRVSVFDHRRIAAVLRKLQWVSKRNKTERWWEPAVTL